MLPERCTQRLWWGVMLGVATLSGSVGAATAREDQPVLEALLGHTVDAAGITYQVRSGGCTRKDDFEVQQLETVPLQLLLVRLRPDLCRALLPYGTRVTFRWEELGITPDTELVVANPGAVIRVHPPLDR